MEQDYYIIRKMPWGYGERPTYYSDKGFTRDIRQVKVFNSVEEAHEIKRTVTDIDSNCVILRM